MRVVCKELPVRGLHDQPALDSVQAPKVVVTAQEIVPTLAELLLFDASQVLCHCSEEIDSNSGLLQWE